MKRFITYLAVLAFFAVMSLPTAVLAADVTDDQVSAAVAGGQTYLAAKQVTPVFGTGVMQLERTTSNFPDEANKAAGSTAKVGVTVSEDGTQLTLIDVVGDNGVADDFTRTSDETSGLVGAWKITGVDYTAELTLSDDGTYNVEAVTGDNTYTATGTYTYDETEKYLKSGGNWSDSMQSAPLASTAFAVSALLETGYKRDSDVIRAGILYILQHVENNPTDKNFGAIVTGDYDDTYNTAACLIALSLYNDTSTEMETIIQNGVDYLESSQVSDDTSAYYGGWSYNKQGDEDWISGDLSNTQFAVMGLWYANRYLGNTIEDQAWTSPLLKFLERCHGWYNPALLVLTTTTSDFPDAFGPEQGTDHLTIAASADGSVDYTTDLTVKMGGSDTLTFTRQNGTGNETSIAGEWQTEDSDGTITINFDADGTYTATGENADGTYSASGTWEVLSQTWNDQDWVKNGYDIWGEAGAFSYQPVNIWFTNGMLGAGLWCLGMIGQDTNPMVDITTAYFADDARYGWNSTGDAYYYAVYAMAKGLTATIGTQQNVGSHDWVKDLKNEMVDPDNSHIQTVSDSDPVQKYWEGSGGLDGGDILSTSWVLMSLAFADPNTPSPQKILADLDEEEIAADPTLEAPPVKGKITMSVEEGVTISGAIRSAVVTKKKELQVTMPIGAVKFKLNNVKTKTVLTIAIPKNALDPKNPNSFTEDEGTAETPNVITKKGLRWFKTDADGNWKGLPNVPIEIDRDAGVIRVTLTDNGPEDTNPETGVIDDPGAPGIDPDAVSSGSSSSSGGCFIQSLF